MHCRLFPCENHHFAAQVSSPVSPLLLSRFCVDMSAAPAIRTHLVVGQELVLIRALAVVVISHSTTTMSYIRRASGFNTETNVSAVHKEWGSMWPCKVFLISISWSSSRWDGHPNFASWRDLYPISVAILLCLGSGGRSKYLGSNYLKALSPLKLLCIWSMWAGGLAALPIHIIQN